MRNTAKSVLFYVLAALYVIAYMVLAIPATPYVMLGFVLDVGADGFKGALRAIFVQNLRYDIDSLWLRIMGDEQEQAADASDVLTDYPLDEDDITDGPQAPGYDHNEHLTYVARAHFMDSTAAYAHTGEHKLITDEE